MLAILAERGSRSEYLCTGTGQITETIETSVLRSLHQGLPLPGKTFGTGAVDAAKRLRKRLAGAAEQLLQLLLPFPTAAGRSTAGSDTCWSSGRQKRRPLSKCCPP